LACLIFSLGFQEFGAHTSWKLATINLSHRWQLNITHIDGYGSAFTPPIHLSYWLDPVLYWIA
jgi:hypothetical protein